MSFEFGKSVLYESYYLNSTTVEFVRPICNGCVSAGWLRFVSWKRPFGVLYTIQ
jgi:hypothetical protein